MNAGWRQCDTQSSIILFSICIVYMMEGIYVKAISVGASQKGVTCTHQSRNSVENTFDCHRELEQVWSCQVPQVLAAALRSHRLVYTCTRCVGCRWLATYTTLVDSILGTPGGWVCSLQLLDDQCRPVAGPIPFLQVYMSCQSSRTETRICLGFLSVHII